MRLAVGLNKRGRWVSERPLEKETLEMKLERNLAPFRDSDSFHWRNKKKLSLWLCKPLPHLSSEPEKPG